MQVVGGLKDNELFSEIHRTGSHFCETSGLFQGPDTQHDSIIPRVAVSKGVSTCLCAGHRKYVSPFWSLSAFCLTHSLCDIDKYGISKTGDPWQLAFMDLEVERIGCGLKSRQITLHWASPIAQMVKNRPAVQEIWVQSLGYKDPLKEDMATHSSTLAWRIPQMRSLAGYSP